jgi:hypothetical protein
VTIVGRSAGRQEAVNRSVGPAAAADEGGGRPVTWADSHPFRPPPPGRERRDGDSRVPRGRAAVAVRMRIADSRSPGMGRVRGGCHS